MFGGSPGYYEVTWDVYKRKDFWRLSFPVSFIFGEPKQFLLNLLNRSVSIILLHNIIGFLNKEWIKMDVVDCNTHWTSKTTECK